MRFITKFCIAFIFILVLICGESVSATERAFDLYRECLEFDMDGNLRMTTHDRIATSNISYKTIGWTIKKQNQVIDGNNIYAIIALEENQLAQVDPKDSKYKYSYFFCDRNTVYNAISQADEAWTQGLYIEGGQVYLDAIMTVCVNGVPQGGLNSDGSSYGEVYNTFRGIANARPWASPESLRTHFNKEVYFPPNPQVFEGTIEVSHYEVKEEDYNHTIPLKRFGKDVVQQKLEGYSYSFHKEDFTAYFFEYQKVHVFYEKHIGEVGDIWQDREENQDGVQEFNNQSYIYKKIIVTYYYIRKEQEIIRIDESFIQEDNLDSVQEFQIIANQKESGIFNVSTAIPTGEFIDVLGTLCKYWYQCTYKNKFGYTTYEVLANVNYTLKWQDSGGNYEELVTKQEIYYIDRYYSYWQIESMQLFTLQRAIISNYAFPDEQMIFTSIYQPMVDLVRSQELDGHKQSPGNLNEITVDGGVIEGRDNRPEHFGGQAQENVERIVEAVQVKNDVFAVDGEYFLEGSWVNQETSLPTLLEETRMATVETTEVPISHRKQNGFNYPSTGYAIYENHETLEQKTKEIQGINAVTIHTPVVCTGIISDDIFFNQQRVPTKEKSLILGKSFLVDIKTWGIHNEYPGYGTKNYRKNITYQQIKFPFEVYYKEQYIKPEQWISIVGETLFYLPTGVKEGDYRVSYRTVAKNYEAKKDGINAVEKKSNMAFDNYVAIDSIVVSIIGRIYGLQIIDVVDYPRWQSVFRKRDKMTPTNFAYVSGTRDENGVDKSGVGNAVFPILEGSHPYNLEAGVVKTGYRMKFKLFTIGNLSGSTDYIRLTPKFYYVDSSGTQRQEVDLYYTETIHGEKKTYVKVGSALDKTNVKNMEMLHPYSFVKKERMEESAQLLNQTVQELYGVPVPIYTYGRILLSQRTRVFVGEISRNVPNEKVAKKSKQEWFGEYHLPAKVYAIKKGTPLLAVRPDFLKKGYIVVQLDIQTLPREIPTLSYENGDNSVKNYCNMWKTEGFLTKRVRRNNKLFLLEEGDVFIYDIDQSLNSDYETLGTH